MTRTDYIAHHLEAQRLLKEIGEILMHHDFDADLIQSRVEVMKVHLDAIEAWAVANQQKGGE